MVKNLPANAGDGRDIGSIPGSGRCPGGGNGTTLQNLCLEHSMGSGAWWAAVHVAAKSYTQLSTQTRIRLIYYKNTRCKKAGDFFFPRSIRKEIEEDSYWFPCDVCSPLELSLWPGRLSTRIVCC